MNWLLRWLAGWRGEGPARLVVVLVDGADLALVDRYLGEGLLPHLALLCDVGQRIDFEDGRVFGPSAICELLRELQIRGQLLSPLPAGADADLDSICAADRTQQERFMTTLRGRRCPAVVAEFSMLAQLEQLYGPSPDDDQRLVLRDVYARMDEVVGKVMSFVDSRTVLLVAIGPNRTPQGITLPVSVFVSQSVSDVVMKKDWITEIVAYLLESSPRRA